MTEKNIQVLTAGLHLASECGWTGKLIARAFLVALTNASLLTERAEIEPSLNSVFDMEIKETG